MGNINELNATPMAKKVKEANEKFKKSVQENATKQKEIKDSFFEEKARNYSNKDNVNKIREDNTNLKGQLKEIRDQADAIRNVPGFIYNEIVEKVDGIERVNSMIDRELAEAQKKFFKAVESERVKKTLPKSEVRIFFEENSGELDSVFENKYSATYENIVDFWKIISDVDLSYNFNTEYTEEGDKENVAKMLKCFRYFGGKMRKQYELTPGNYVDVSEDNFEKNLMALLKYRRGDTNKIIFDEKAYQKKLVIFTKKYFNCFINKNYNSVNIEPKKIDIDTKTMDGATKALGNVLDRIK